VIQKNWRIDSTPVVLKMWTPLFDARRERFDIALLWVRLPGLPMDFWSPSIFKNIGYALGVFLEADASYENSRDMTMARILVSLDVREGLAEEMEISHGGRSHIQSLDYDGVSFRCRRCHAYGHLIDQCHFPFRVPKDSPSTLTTRNLPTSVDRKEIVVLIQKVGKYEDKSTLKSREEPVFSKVLK
jgi:hypothetical protein